MSRYAALVLSFLLCGCGNEVEISDRGSVFYQAYEIEPAFLTPQEFGHKDISELFPSANQTIHEFMNEIGIEFIAPNSAAITGLAYPGFGMRNTAEYHEILVRSLDKRFPGKWAFADADYFNQTLSKQDEPLKL